MVVGLNGSHDILTTLDKRFKEIIELVIKTVLISTETITNVAKITVEKYEINNDLLDIDLDVRDLTFKAKEAGEIVIAEFVGLSIGFELYPRKILTLRAEIGTFRYPPGAIFHREITRSKFEDYSDYLKDFFDRDFQKKFYEENIWVKNVIKSLEKIFFTKIEE